MTAIVVTPTSRIGRTAGLSHSRLGVIIAHDMKTLLTGASWQFALIIVISLFTQVSSNSAYRSADHFQVLWMVGCWIAVSLLKCEIGSDTIEPILATGARRWEIVVAKLVVIGLCFFLFLLALAAVTLATLLYPIFMPHLQPRLDPKCCAVVVGEMLLANTAGGLEIIGFVLVCGALYVRDRSRGPGIIVIAILIVFVPLGALPLNAPELMIFPLLNGWQATTVILQQLRAPVQVGFASAQLFGSNYLPLLIAESLIMTAVFTAIAVRSLERVSLADTRPRHGWRVR